MDLLINRLRVAIEQNRCFVSDIATPAEQRKVGQACKTLMQRARWYFVDQEATAAGALLGVSHPELMGQILKNSRLPFSTIWVEWDPKEQLRAVGAKVEANAPDLTGAFVERLHPTQPTYRMTFIGPDVLDPTRIVPTPISVVYDLEDPSRIPISTEETQKFYDVLGIDRQDVNNSVLGYAYLNTIGTFREGDTIRIPAGTELVNDDIFETAGLAWENEKRVRIQQCNAVAQHAQYTFSPMAWALRDALIGPNTGKVSVANREAIRQYLRTLIYEFAGSWRTIISIIALINAKDYVSSTPTTLPGRLRVSNVKTVPYLEHHVVSLKIPRKTVIQKVTRVLGQSLPKRRHDVEGHYCNSHRLGDPTCEHPKLTGCPKAVYVNETDLREVCVAIRDDGTTCGHKRWWKNDFMRGDASVGFVTKDKRVQKRQSS